MGQNIMADFSLIAYDEVKDCELNFFFLNLIKHYIFVPLL